MAKRADLVLRYMAEVLLLELRSAKEAKEAFVAAMAGALRLRSVVKRESIDRTTGAGKTTRQFVSRNEERVPREDVKRRLKSELYNLLQVEGPLSEEEIIAAIHEAVAIAEHFGVKLHDVICEMIQAQHLTLEEDTDERPTRYAARGQASIHLAGKTPETLVSNSREVASVCLEICAKFEEDVQTVEFAKRMQDDPSARPTTARPFRFDGYVPADMSEADVAEFVRARVDASLVELQQRASSKNKRSLTVVLGVLNKRPKRNMG